MRVVPALASPPRLAVLRELLAAKESGLSHFLEHDLPAVLFRLTDLPVVIAYSGGGSSEWLVRAVINGTLPRPKYLLVVFADTGEEHSWTYGHVAEVKAACVDAGIEFVECSAGTKLGDDLIALKDAPPGSRADQPPVYVEKGFGRGVAQHRCTRYYKVAPMRRAVSAWLKRLGLPKQVEKWIGYAADEAGRAQKTAQNQDVQWEILRFPAIETGRRRGQQHIDLIRWTGRVPRFSMCTCCPKHTPSRWFETAEFDPPGIERAIKVDESIRDLDCIGITEGPAYLSDRIIPLSRLIEGGDPQPDLPGLEVYCDGGACFL